MASTIGQQLRSAREAKSLSVKDVAHETRIHANFIRSLEADDYSGFASITYAKSFLQLYSRFLGIDASEALTVFRGGGALNLQGADVFTEVHETVNTFQSLSDKSPGRKRRRKSEKPGGAPFFLAIVLGALFVAIPAFYYLGWDAENAEDLPGEIAENAKKAIEGIQKGSEKKSEENSGVNEVQPNPIAVGKVDTAKVPTKPIEVLITKPKAIPKPEIVSNKKPAKPKLIIDAPAVAKPPVKKPVPLPIRATPLIAKPTVLENTQPKPSVNGPASSPKSAKGKPKSVVAIKPQRPKPVEKPAAETTPIRAMPIVARPIMSNEDPDERPIEDITPKPKKKPEAEDGSE